MACLTDYYHQYAVPEAPQVNLIPVYSSNTLIELIIIVGISQMVRTFTAINIHLIDYPIPLSLLLYLLGYTWCRKLYYPFLI